MYTQTQKYAMPQVVAAKIFMTLTFDLISILIRNILKPTKINIFGDLDRWPIFYLLWHKVHMKYWSIHTKFQRNQSSINGLYAADTHTNT